MAKVKLKHLESYLQDVQDFDNPQIELEQYSTTPHIAAHMLHTIESRFGDIGDKMVADLGCGTGMLSVGIALLGAGFCIGADIDTNALATCRRNIDDAEINNVDIVQMNIREHLKITDHPWTGKFDTVIMNPPFGTRDEGADSEFLLFALKISRSSIYSLHKQSTVQHFARLAKSHQVTFEEVAQLNFDLPKTYRFQRCTSKDISVAVLRFTHLPVVPGKPWLLVNLPADEAIESKRAVRKGKPKKQ